MVWQPVIVAWSGFIPMFSEIHGKSRQTQCCLCRSNLLVREHSQNGLPSDMIHMPVFSSLMILSNKDDIRGGLCEGNGFKLNVLLQESKQFMCYLPAMWFESLPHKPHPTHPSACPVLGLRNLSWKQALGGKQPRIGHQHIGGCTHAPFTHSCTPTVNLVAPVSFSMFLDCRGETTVPEGNLTMTWGEHANSIHMKP